MKGEQRKLIAEVFITPAAAVQFADENAEFACPVRFYTPHTRKFVEDYQRACESKGQKARIVWKDRQCLTTRQTESKSSSPGANAVRDDNGHFCTAYYRRIGEFRPPKAGEFYLSGAIPQAWKALQDMTTSYHIVVEVPRPATEIVVAGWLYRLEGPARARDRSS